MTGLCERTLTTKALLNGTDGVHFQGDQDAPITGLVDDSRQVQPGDLFFAVGPKGESHMEEALKRGAVGVISGENVRVAMARAAKAFYKAPDEELHLIGVTGTNGKTTVTTLLQHLMGNSGLIGTVKHDLGARVLSPIHTTPEALALHQMLREIKDSGYTGAAMEVSSHGLALKRVYGLDYDVAVFLNLSQDHLDFHGGMEEYYLDKRKLFNGENGAFPKHAVINIDDPYGRRLAGELKEPVTFGFSGEAAFRAENLKMDENGVIFDLIWPEGRVLVSSKLLGEFNVSNILAALAVCWASGISIPLAIERLKDFNGVRGRMERVDSDRDFLVLVDYAHTEDALRRGIEMLKKVIKGRVLVVFGCGGDRDKNKRPKMTRAVQELADFAWATSDNPRNEPIEAIFKDMQKGATSPAMIAFEPDRKKAIQSAIEAAQPGDSVLIAGKGHETYQEFANGTRMPFDDVAVAKSLITD